MNKILDGFDVYPYEDEKIKKDSLRRVSRWITIKRNYTPGKNNLLWDYVRDSYGRAPYQDGFAPEDGLCLDYFRFNGRNYALEQFYSFGSAWYGVGCFSGYIENGEKYYLHGVQANEWYRPLVLEMDECCERVRVYMEV